MLHAQVELLCISCLWFRFHFPASPAKWVSLLPRQCQHSHSSLSLQRQPKKLSFSSWAWVFPPQPYSPCLMKHTVMHHHPQHCPTQQFMGRPKALPLQRCGGYIKDTCVGSVCLCRQWKDPSMPLHKVEELRKQWLTLQCLPRSKNNKFTPHVGERDVHPPPILDKVTDLEKQRNTQHQ